jgi:serine/threonine protein kinase
MLSAGMKMGVYEVTAALGAGGMGEVYRARDTRLGRDVALKVLPAEFAQDPSRRMRFEGEARSVAALNHPNIVVLYDIGTQDGFAAPTFRREKLPMSLLRSPMASPRPTRRV